MWMLIYSSIAAFPLDEHEVAALLADCRVRNGENGISGLLLHVRLDAGTGAFVQVLEGPETAVEETYGRIERDELHHHLHVLAREEIEQRRFGDWTMRFAEAELPAHAALRDRVAVEKLIDSCRVVS